VGLTKCGAACVNLLVDGQHCGACGKKCKSTESCLAGACLKAGGI
jgi:hypothetical protein